MDTSNSFNSQIPLMKRYLAIIGIVWTAAVSASFVWNWFEVDAKTLEAARIQARSSFEKDVMYRRWNAGHGGIYVPVTEKIAPNPYLQVPHRDIVTTSGQVFTLINPAFMTRLVHEIQEGQSGTKGHITSLNPIRGENKPDEWETYALKVIEHGQEEVTSVENLRGISYVRLMRPLVTEEGCLKCHAAQGYKVGDIRGGISVAVPMGPLWNAVKGEFVALSIGHCALWLFGLVGLTLGGKRLEKGIDGQENAEKALRTSHEELKEANSMIMDSIYYAQNIQSAILPSAEKLANLLDNYFIIWQPRDVIGGDLYWLDGADDELVLAVMDCTGHGVPGAILTMIAATSLSRAIHEIGSRDPGALLGRMNTLVRDTLRKRQEGKLYDDGLDMGICHVNKRSRKAIFAGGRISLFLCSNGHVTEIKGDTESLGYQSSDPDHRFHNHHVELSASTDLYLTTDGLIEQIGGSNKLPFGKNRFSQFILENYSKPLHEQRNTLLDTFLNYRGAEDQRDDVTVFGVRVQVDKG
ncbi:MAG: SpoIIE family protein phosphatase [Desulfomonile sp.]